MSGHVFISYSRSDASGPALALADRLRAQGQQVWIDQRNIPVTVPWMAEIKSGIWGAAVVVLVDTPGWRSSENCQFEARIAQEISAPQVMVSATAHPDSSTAEVTGLVQQLPNDERTRSELFERADHWHNHGRSPRSLASGRALARYRLFTGARQTTAIPTEVSAYLTASDRRQRRRTTWRRAGSLAAVALILGGISIFNGLGGAQQKLDDAIHSFSGSQQFEAAWDTDPYLYLDVLSRSDSKGAAIRAQFSRAFGTPLPDAVSTDAPSPEQVRVFDASRASRVAAPRSRVAQLDDARRTVTVTRDGDRYRSIGLDDVAPAMAWSPAGDWLLVADGPDVVAHDVEFGNAPLRLRGGSGTLTALAVDGTGISGRTDARTVIHWPSPFETPITTEDDAFSDAEQIADTDLALALPNTGSLVTIDVSDASVEGIRKLPVNDDTVTRSVSVSEDGTTALVTAVDTATSETRALVVPLNAGTMSTIPLPNCVPLDIAWATAETAYVACGNAGVGVLSVASGDFRVTSLPHGTRATSVAGTGSRMFVGTNIGLTLNVDPASGEVISEGGTGCAQDIEALTVTDDGHLVFHAGDATANLGCGARGNFTALDEPRWNRFYFPWQTIDRAGSVTLSGDNRFVAFGFADGQVRVFTADTMEPIGIHRPTTAGIRGLAFDSTNTHLLSVTVDGTAVRLDLDPDAADLDHQRRRAVEFVDRARQLGLYAG